jgi:hypothetical protein
MGKERFQDSYNQPEKKFSGEGSQALQLLDQAIQEPQMAHLGQIVIRSDIPSLTRSRDNELCQATFQVLPEYIATYPQRVIQALANLYAEYNQAFAPIIEANREWGTDYRYGYSLDGTSVNRWVQIDMVGLPEKFLEAANTLGEQEIQNALRSRIFEIENSLARNAFMELVFSRNNQDSFFKRQMRASLDELRQRYGKKIALLAVTEQKYLAMKETEFGKREEEPLTDEYVRELTGFDRFFHPEGFIKHLEENNGSSDYLLYVRSSDPVSKLKDPTVEVEHPLLSDENVRRIIKAYAITFNIDAPRMDPTRRINDTKEYLPIMRMGYAVHTLTDMFTPEFAAYMSSGKPYKEYNGTERLAREFILYLQSQGVDPAMWESGETSLHFKPLKGTYGCYGHIHGPLSDKEFRQQLRKNMGKRGSYVVQPKMQCPVIINATDGKAYTFIDRVFFTSDGMTYRFMGGFRSLMPLDSIEAKNGRNHGSEHTVWAEIQ